MGKQRKMPLSVRRMPDGTLAYPFKLSRVPESLGTGSTLLRGRLFSFVVKELHPDIQEFLMTIEKGWPVVAFFSEKDWQFDPVPVRKIQLGSLQ